MISLCMWVCVCVCVYVGLAMHAHRCVCVRRYNKSWLHPWARLLHNWWCPWHCALCRCFFLHVAQTLITGVFSREVRQAMRRTAACFYQLTGCTSAVKPGSPESLEWVWERPRDWSYQQILIKSLKLSAVIHFLWSLIPCTSSDPDWQIIPCTHTHTHKQTMLTHSQMDFTRARCLSLWNMCTDTMHLCFLTEVCAEEEKTPAVSSFEKCRQAVCVIHSIIAHMDNPFALYHSYKWGKSIFSSA